MTQASIGASRRLTLPRGERADIDRARGPPATSASPRSAATGVGAASEFLTFELAEVWHEHRKARQSGRGRDCCHDEDGRRHQTSQFANAANLYGGALGSSFKAVQDYQTKLMQFFQANAEANVAGSPRS